MKKYYLDKRTLKSGRNSILELNNTLDLYEYIVEVLQDAEVVEISGNDLLNKIANNQLIPDNYYLISDFQSCYDQPDFDQFGNAITTGNYKQGPVEPILVKALTTNNLDVTAFNTMHPKDTIKFDISFTTTEITASPALGRITECIDEFGNRTDYDHHNILFKRYRYYYYNQETPINGTVELQSDGTVLGTLTDFVNDLSVGSIIAIPASPGTFYEVTLITDQTTMTVTAQGGINPTVAGQNFYYALGGNYDSYKQNNLDLDTLYTEYTTFGDSPLNLNNYVGDYSLSYIYDGVGQFLLANNVFKDGDYIGNTFGICCYNNTFNDDCSNNKVGNFFTHNITDDDFDGNVIGNYFEYNEITANFQYNQIGESFENNKIYCSDFYRNVIGNSFYGNYIGESLDFQNNTIGNQFNNNTIYYNSFYKNHINNGYNNNIIHAENYGNTIGNGFNGNAIYAYFYENSVGDLFQNNTIGDIITPTNFSFYKNTIRINFGNNLINGNFFRNQIGNDYTNNTIGDNFAFNHILDYFQNNTIGNDFGFGGATEQGNTIGNNFQGNTIGEYFYNNSIQDVFAGNNIADYFTNNKISYGFTSNLNILNNFQDNQILIPLTTVDFALATYVYGSYNCTIYTNSNGDIRLSYIDALDAPQYGIAVNA